MAEQETPPHYDETSQPQNPPNSIVNKGARRAFLTSYFAPLIVLFVIAGLGLIYWSNRGPSEPDRDTTHTGVGTTGENGPGAFDPRPRASNTKDEIEFRGGVDDPTQGPMPALRDATPLTKLDEVAKDASFVSGRRVDVSDVEVDSVQANSFWVRDGSHRVEVIAPEGSSIPAKGAHVRVVGSAEGAGGDTARIRATSISAR
jgi:hypothetical protein